MGYASLVRSGRAGKILRSRRIQAGLTLKEGSEFIGASRSTLGMIERGKRQIVADAFLELYDFYNQQIKENERCRTTSTSSRPSSIPVSSEVTARAPER